MKKAIMTLIMIFTVVFAAGCVEKKESDFPSPTEAVVPFGEDGKPIENVHQVRIIDNMVYPTEVVIQEGETVEWVNEDDYKHTITFEGDDIVFDEEIGKNARLSLQFGYKGTYSYGCRITPSMRGQVIVR